MPDNVKLPAVTHPKPAGQTRLTKVPTRTTPAKAQGFNAKTSVALPKERTATTETYANADGTKTRRTYTTPVNAQRPDGTWAPIDLTLAPNGKGRLAPRLAPSPVDFGPTAAGPSLAQLAMDAGHSIAFGLQDATDAPASLSGEHVTYRGARPDVDVRLAATTTGVKEELILRSPKAPTVYDFTLDLRGLTPTLDRVTGDIRLADQQGRPQAVIPAGWMLDDNGVESRAVTYRLSRAGNAWQLRVTLDATWLKDPSRAYPVVVDPSATTINTDLDDTYVVSGSPGNRSGEDTFQIGKTDGRSRAAYLHFAGLTSGLRNQYIVGATVNLTNIESASCTPKPVDVFAVGAPWSGSTLTTWPGAPLGQHLAQASFAYGHSPGCAAGGRASFVLPADLVTDWTHGIVPFHGLSVRAANESDTGAYKRFTSGNASGTAAPGRPYLDVTYSPQGAAYHVDEVLLPTAGHTGRLKATVTNRGATTWTPSTHKFAFMYKRKDGTAVNGWQQTAVPSNVGPNAKVLMDVPMPPVPAPGLYDVYLTMFDGATDFGLPSTYGVSYGIFEINVQNVKPSVNYEQPGSGGRAGTITPTLYAEGVDTDHWPNKGLTFQFRICTKDDGTTGCTQSDWTNATWAPPPGTLQWSKTYFWWVHAHDTVDPGDWVGPLVLTTVVPQPEVTSHLGGTPNSEPAPGLDPQVGNFGMETTDHSVATVGPDLTIARTYNSLDPRTDTAFGQGWTSRLDTQLVEDVDGSRNVVATLPSGRTIRFGRNADGTYAPPEGENLTLVYASGPGTYTLRDSTGTRWEFNVWGRLRAIVDPAGLVEELEYDDAGPTGKPKSIYNLASKRRLYLTWTGGHVTKVTTDPPASGQPGLSWTYIYDGHKLTNACDPGVAPNCTKYDYQTGSHYRSVVVDDRPRAYWRFGESTASTGAQNVNARTPGADKGTYTSVTLGAPGALAGTADTAASFGGPDGQSRVVLPSKLHSPVMSVSVELWFKTTSGGVLMSYADKQFGQAQTKYVPVLYVGDDGFVRGSFWAPTAEQRQLVSQQEVNDGAWHHAVLAGAINSQKLYVDGVAQPGTISGPIDHDEMPELVVGVGNTKFWPSGNDGTYFFTGSIDEVAVYTHTLGDTAVAQHYAAAQPVQQLTKVTQPQDNRVATTLTYDDINDRVATYTDADGRDWRLDPTSQNEAVRKATLHGPYPDWTYEFDADHGGRLTKTTTDSKVRDYKYNSEGFLSEQIDENRHVGKFTTDARGNVLSKTTCRATDSCQTTYSTYFLNAGNPLDPKNDAKLSDSDARSSGPDDTRYRISYGYDTAGRQTSTTYPRPIGSSTTPVETWKYSNGTEAAEGGGLTPAGLLIEQKGRRTDEVTTYKYRSNGDLAEQVDPVGLRTRNDYDGIGRKLSETNVSAAGSEFGTTIYTYTPRSQVETVTGPATRNSLSGVDQRLITSYRYDANGNVLEETQTDTAGKDPARKTSYDYDAHNKLAATTYPDSRKETIEFRNAGMEVRRTDPRGTVWIQSYDSQGNLLRSTASGPGVDPQDPSATVLTLETRTYDKAGRLWTSRDAIGRVTTYTYYDDDLLATVTTANVQQEKWEYDPAGNVTRRTSAGGRVLETTYDDGGFPATETLDPGGVARKVAYTRGPDGRSVTESHTGAAESGRTETTSYGYDAAGRLVREDVAPTSGDTLRISYTRDERGLVTGRTDRRRLTTNYGYDAYGRQVSETQPEVETWVNGQLRTGVRPQTVNGYNAFGDLTHQRNANGALTVLTYDKRGRNTSMQLPAYTPPGGQAIQAVSETAYDELGNPSTSTDPLDRVTERTYDPYGRVRTETKPKVGDLPSTTTTTYTRSGEVASVVDANQTQRLFTYDDFDRLKTATSRDRYPEPAFYITEYGYDDAGNLASVKTPAGGLTKYDHNKADELISVTDPENKVTRYDYDILGREAKVVQPSGLETRTTYDLLGYARTFVQLSGSPLTERRRWTQDFDANGNLAKTTSSEGRVRTYGYDSANRLVWQDERADASKTIRTAFGYDPAGNHTRLVDGRQNATTYTYTPWNQPESTIEPGNATWTTAYDAAGQEARREMPGGVRQTMTYDPQGNLRRVQGTGAEATSTDRTYDYDAGNRLSGFGGSGGGTTLTYDDRGNLLTQRGAAGNATYSYDADSRPATRSDASGSSTFRYDLAGNPKAVFDGLSGQTIDYTYDSAGRLAYTSESDLGQYVKRVRTYDNLDRVASDSVTELDPGGAGARVVTGTEYGYDLDDNLTSKSALNNNQRSANSYGYDGLDRLKTWTAPSGTQTAYEWDDAGNRTKAGSTTYTYNARNQLTTDGSATYTYTPRGGLASVGTRTMKYNAFEELVQDGSTQYGYDSLGRVASRNGTAFTYNSMANDVVSDGTRVTSRGPSGEPVADKAIAASTTAKLLYADQHDDVTGRFRGLESFGQKTFDPFGNVVGSSGEQAGLGYQGEWTDPSTNAVNMHSRWYTPGTGTFASRDTWKAPTNPSVAANRYSYGNASPMLNTDPSGHFVWILIAVVVSVGIEVAKAQNAGTADAPTCHGSCVKNGNSKNYPKGSSGYTSMFPGGPYQPLPWATGPGGGSGGPGGGGKGPGGGKGSPAVKPPPPPPPLWWINLYDPPRRPDPGTTTPFRPPTKPSTDDDTDVIDKSDDYDDEANKRTEDDEPPEGMPDPRVSPLPGHHIGDPEGHDDRVAGCLNGAYEEGYYRYYPLDPPKGGRATGAEACLMPGKLPGTGANRKSPGRASADVKDYNSKVHDKGHLIGANLGGRGNVSENLVPLYKDANQREMYNNFEKCVRERVDAGEIVHVTVVPQYNDNSGVPVGVTLQAVGNKGYVRTMSIRNKPDYGRRPGMEYCA
ncbi:RHS repeat-associated core domain-containing protein [Flindersiella endophytica]